MSFRLCVVDFDVTGRSIPVVRLLWEQVDRVRFSAPRHVAFICGRKRALSRDAACVREKAHGVLREFFHQLRDACIFAPVHARTFPLSPDTDEYRRSAVAFLVAAYRYLGRPVPDTKLSSLPLTPRGRTLRGNTGGLIAAGL